MSSDLKVTIFLIDNKNTTVFYLPMKLGYQYINAITFFSCLAQSIAYTPIYPIHQWQLVSNPDHLLYCILPQAHDFFPYSFSP